MGLRPKPRADAALPSSKTRQPSRIGFLTWERSDAPPATRIRPAHIRARFDKLGSTRTPAEAPISKKTERDSTPPPSQLPDSELPRLLTPPPVSEHTRKGRLLALGVLLGLAFLMLARIAAPMWVGIALGTFAAFTAQPTYRKIASKLGNRKPLAAALTTLIFGLAGALAAFVVMWVLINEITDLVAAIQAKLAGKSLSQMVGPRVRYWFDRLHVPQEKIRSEIERRVGELSNYAASAVPSIVGAAASALLGLVIGLMTMYYVLLEWPRLPVRLEKVLPLDPRHTRALVIEFRDVGRSALIGTIATALVQGIMSGLGYLIFGVPHPITWALVTALASLIPAIGTALVWAPVGVYLIIIGHGVAGVMELIWGAIMVVAVCDYVIRPRLAAKEGGHPLLMLIALLGGIEVFGLPGLIVGPVMVSLFVAILRIYEREVQWEAAHNLKK